MRVWVGTSGYSYPDWVGPFYPDGTRPAQMLSHYCRHFPLLELNYTFYRPPTASALARLADQTPAGFQFLVKLPATVSHERSLGDVPGFRHAAEQLRQRGKLSGVLCQLPQSCHNDAESRPWIERLSRELEGFGPAVEFRHRSWHRPEMPGWLGSLGVCVVSVDVPDIAALYPRGLVLSGPTAYVRLHSRNAGNWYHGEKGRYDYDYRDEELAVWVDALNRAAGGGTERAWILFNNCQRHQAVVNARRLREIVARLAPDLEVVPPLAPPAPTQRSLFE